MKRTEVARNVRVKFNSNFKEKSLADKYIMEEPIIFISEGHVYNDINGEYVFVKGGSMINSTPAYLTELDLEFPISEDPLYFTVDYSWKDSAIEFLLSERDRIEKQIYELDEMALINSELKKLNN
ncbi:MAG TPA: hypothetical protein VLA48_02745 [Nitrososphaeraceae archaeon]|nr:hypothetical protein [Nitrososphaeraceae archaeon]